MKASDVALTAASNTNLVSLPAIHTYLLTGGVGRMELLCNTLANLLPEAKVKSFRIQGDEWLCDRLEELVVQFGATRDDSGLPLNAPGLDEHWDDIPLLATYFIQKSFPANSRDKNHEVLISLDFLLFLLCENWRDIESLEQFISMATLYRDMAKPFDLHNALHYARAKAGVLPGWLDDARRLPVTKRGGVIMRSYLQAGSRLERYGREEIEWPLRYLNWDLDLTEGDRFIPMVPKVTPSCVYPAMRNLEWLIAHASTMERLPAAESNRIAQVLRLRRARTRERQIAKASGFNRFQDYQDWISNYCLNVEFSDEVDVVASWNQARRSLRHGGTAPVIQSRSSGQLRMKRGTLTKACADNTYIYSEGQNSDKYSLTDKFAGAVDMMMRYQQRHNQPIKKDAVYTQIDREKRISSLKSTKYSPSLYKFFVNGGGDNARFAKDGFIVTMSKGTAQIPLSPDRLIFEADSKDEVDSD